MLPTPFEVARTVAEIISAPWPTTDAEARRWLGEVGVVAETAREAPRVRDSRSWHQASVPAWGDATAGWNSHREQFIGVFWFLWASEDSDEVLESGDELAALVEEQFGAPDSADIRTWQGSTWLWNLPDHTIDIYAHRGRVHGDRVVGACVQLHVDHRARAEVRNAEDEAAEGNTTPHS